MSKNTHILSLSLDIDVRIPTALISLSGNDLIVVRSQVQSIATPSVEVILHSDRAAGSLALADRPVLVEGPGAFDGWLVYTLGDVYIVSAAIGGVASLVLSAAAGVVCAEVLYHVVLHKWVVGPAVDGEIGIARRIEAATIVDGAVGFA